PRGAGDPCQWTEALALPGDEEPDERQPQLAGVWDRPIVHQDFGRVRGTDNFEQLSQTGGVGGPESRAVAPRGARPGFAELGRRAREVEGGREIGGVQMGKHQRDRERTWTRAEQRLVQVRIERSELLVGRLLR